MKQVIKLELLNSLNRKEFRLVFILMFLFSIGGFLIECFRFYGHNLTFIRSSFDTSLIRGVYAQNLFRVELLLLPLFSAMIYSDSYYSVNQFLTLLAFPVHGYDNNYAYPPYDIGIANYRPSDVFDLLRIQFPLLYNVLYMFLISIFATLFALFTFGIFFYVNKGKFIVTDGVFLMYIAQEVVLSSTGFSRYSILNTITPSLGTLFSLLMWLLLLFTLSYLMISRQYKGSVEVVE